MHLCNLQIFGVFGNIWRCCNNIIFGVFGNIWSICNNIYVCIYVTSKYLEYWTTFQTCWRCMLQHTILVLNKWLCVFGAKKQNIIRSVDLCNLQIRCCMLQHTILVLNKWLCVSVYVCMYVCTHMPLNTIQFDRPAGTACSKHSILATSYIYVRWCIYIYIQKFVSKHIFF